MKEKINIRYYSLEEFLCENVIKYAIPCFQRAYTWEDREIESFLDSIFKKEEETSLFLGTVYYYTVEYKNRYIADGQQRLISLYLIVNALRLLNETDEFLLEIKPNIEVYEGAPIFERIFNIKNISELETLKTELPDNNLTIHQIVENQEIVYNYLENFDLAREQFNLSIKDTSFMFLYIPKNYNVFQIFRDINSKGKYLNDNDIIKNIFFSFITDEPGVHFSRQEKYILWKRIENNMLNISENISLIDMKKNLERNLTTLLNYYLSFTIKKFISTSTFKTSYEYENEITKSNAKNKLIDIEKFSISSKYVFYPHNNIPTIRSIRECHEYIISLNGLGIKQPIVLFTALYYMIINKRACTQVKDREKLNHLFEKIYIFHFFFSTITSNRPSKIGRIYQNTALNVFHGDFNYDNLKEVLDNNFPNISEMNNIIDSLLFYVKNGAQKKLENEILKEYKHFNGKYEIESFLKLLEYIFGKEEHIHYNNIVVETIEHIYNSSSSYPNFDNFKLFSFLPLEDSLNQECNGLSSNPHLKDKIIIYSKSNYLTVKKFVAVYNAEKDKSDRNIMDKWLELILTSVSREFAAL